MIDMLTGEDDIIIRHTHNWFEVSNMNPKKFAIDLLAPAAGDALNNDATEREYVAWCSKQIVRVHRILSKKQVFPLSLKWPWLSALPVDIRQRCLSDLAAAQGFIYTLPPITGSLSQEASLNEVMDRVSHLLSNSQPAHDGVYDDKDPIDRSNAMIDACFDCVAKLIDEVQKIHAGTGAQGTRHQLQQFLLQNGGVNVPQ